jgi:hypothetical protein
MWSKNRPMGGALALCILASLAGRATAAEPQETGDVSTERPLVLAGRNGQATANVQIGLMPVTKGDLAWALWPSDEFRRPHTMVNQLTITVSGHKIETPMSAAMGLYDVHRASLRTDGPGFVLDLEGGDGGTGYDAHIRFNRNRVQGRTLFTFGLLSEETSYKVVVLK